MEIGGFQACSLLDYPKHLSLLVFTQGCNFNCHYCHNKLLIPKEKGIVTEQEVFSLLEKYKHMLQAVVITGGEPTLQPDLLQFIKKVKKYGMKVKVDTNGSKPEVLKKILPFVDFIAMDYKAGLNNYNDIAQSKDPDVANKIKESIKYILNSGVQYQFRTTGNYDREQVEKEMKNYVHVFQEVRIC